MLDVLIIGAGPAGLAAAIAAKTRGLSYVVLEKGGLVNSLQRYPVDMVFFTTPELLEIGGLPFVSPHDKPTRQEALRYYRRVTDFFGLDIRFDETVTRVERLDDGGFSVTAQPRHGAPIARQAQAVVVASGAYDMPNRIGVPGEDLPHVSHYYQEAHSSYRKRVVIVGGKNSAAEAALELYRGGAHVTMVHRRATLGASIKYWVKPDIENRIAEGSIAARFEAKVVEITPESVVIEHSGSRESLPADHVLLLTGYHADFDLLRACGIEIDEASGVPLHDPSTLESTSVAGVFFAGGVLAGKDTAPIFIENGRFHGERIVKVLGERR